MRYLSDGLRNADTKRDTSIIFTANATGQNAVDNVHLTIAALSWESTGLPMDRGPELPWV
jgi:hypothetical protein